MNVSNTTTMSPATTPSSSQTSEGDFLWMELLFGVSMFVGCFLSYTLPIKLLEKRRMIHSDLDASQRLHVDREESDHSRHEETANKVLRWCNCFGAGIFVSVCFLGVMPIVHEEFDSYFRLVGVTAHVDYPVAELTTLLGFFLVLFLEEIIHLYRKSEDNQSHIHPHVLLPSSPSQGLPVLHSDAEDEELHHKDNRPHQTVRHPHVHSHSHSHSHMIPSHGAGFTFFILMFATSIHSIFEGMALGLIREPSRAIHIFIGIILHECIVAVALGLNSFRLESPSGHSRNSSTSATMFGLIFSATIPVGMVIGIAVGYTPGSFGKLISAIFQGLAAGTFLHVAFCELIPEELNSSEMQHETIIIDDHVTDNEEDEIDLTGSNSVNGGHNHVLSPSMVFRGSTFYESKLFRIILIFAGFVFMAIVTLFIDHNE